MERNYGYVTSILSPHHKVTLQLPGIKNLSVGIFLFVLYIFDACHGQVLKRPVANAYTGLDAYSSNEAEVSSFPANQASLAKLRNSAVAVYGERKFFLPQLSYYNLAFAIVSHYGNFGLEGSYYGYKDYNESKLGLAYARELGSKVDVGIQFNYNGITITGYGRASTASFEAGSIFHITDQLHAGVHLDNPVGRKFGWSHRERMPSVYTFGLGYETSSVFFTGLEVIKEEDGPVTINAGVRYKPLPQLLLGIGLLTATSSIWACVGFIWDPLRIDISFSFHPQLGFTPASLFLFNFRNKQLEN